MVATFFRKAKRLYISSQMLNGSRKFEPAILRKPKRQGTRRLQNTKAIKKFNIRVGIAVCLTCEGIGRLTGRDEYSELLIRIIQRLLRTEQHWGTICREKDAHGPAGIWN